jgi:hypothetical protein
LLGAALSSRTAATQTGCWPSGTPLGALPPATPIWCKAMTSGPATYVNGDNSWIDEFDAGLMNAEMGDGYRVFEGGGKALNQSKHFRYNNHWKVDINGFDQTPDDGPYNVGGSTMRPDRSFRFENGKLVVEADISAGIDAYGSNAWTEFVVTTAPAPTGRVVDNLYSYGLFGGHWATGIRLQPFRTPIAAMYDHTGRSVSSGGRVFEISYFQPEGAQVIGGGPWGPGETAWRTCADTDPDQDCRDRFRWELTRDTLTLFVNNVKYMEHRGLPAAKQLPDALLNGDVYVYFSSWIWKPGSPAVRFHWDRVAVNPGSVTPPTDKPPLEIGVIQSSRIGRNAATIEWETSLPADGQVEYGRTASYGSRTGLNPGLVTSHSERLTGLRRNTLYHYRVRSRDESGTLVVSSDRTFRTRR